MENMEEKSAEMWNDMDNKEEKSKKIWTIGKKIVKWYGKYGRKGWTDLENIGKKTSLIVIRYGKFGRK